MDAPLPAGQPVIVGRMGVNAQARRDFAVSCAPMPELPPPPRVVIDTQVVMDWLVFNDVRARPLIEALLAGKVRWIGHSAMLDELKHVLGRGVAAAYGPDLALVERTFAEHCEMIEREPASALRLVCRDKDDQKFIDLAIAETAAWLISRDRAVLALAKRARAAGLEIGTPEDWLKKQQDRHRGQP